MSFGVDPKQYGCVHIDMKTNSFFVRIYPKNLQAQGKAKEYSDTVLQPLVDFAMNGGRFNTSVAALVFNGANQKSK